MPEPINPIGYQSWGGNYVTAWRFQIRLITRGQPLDIIEVGLAEEGVGEWIIEELFRERGRLSLPIPVERATDFWISARSPRTSHTKPLTVGQITLRFRDHTQPPGEAHQYVVTNPPIS